ncbi:MAG TPA: Txe/YoeB family addiction module toxin [Chitinophagaceae bacterium]
MEIVYTDEAIEDLLYWKNSGDIALQKRIKKLVENIKISPTSGIGKPELLKHNLKGHWSRRITQEHRLVYRIEADKIIIIQARYHY